MNVILRNTHKKENIELLKARDYYFDRAKRWNLIKNALLVSPPLLLMISYLSITQKLITEIDEIRDILIGCLSVAVFICICFIDMRIGRQTQISNALREEYDVRVLDIPKDVFLSNEQNLDSYRAVAVKVPYYYKYEVWYEEVFSPTNYHNVFCSQLDNILYSFYAYRATKKLYQFLLALLSIVVLTMIVLSKDSGSAILIVLASFECFKTLIEKIQVLTDGIDRCNTLRNSAMALTPDDLDLLTVRCMQHGVAENRNAKIFIPKIIRSHYLKEDSVFYDDLNVVKARFLGEYATIPESADDIDVMSEDGQSSVALSSIQSRLKQIFIAVKEVLEKEQIPYMIDGGTLLGAVRQNPPGFLFWDDDIDIAIPIDYVNTAKQAIQKALPYVIQDVESDRYYSPRLSTFRVREPNNCSIVSEKDSALYPEYTSRGIFLDMYTYSPVLYTVTIDKLFRRLFIHPLNRQIATTERKYYKYKSRSYAEKKFLRQKQTYMQRFRWYTAHAKNKSYYVYSPNYVDNLSKAGPYHTARDLYGEVRHMEWEGLNCQVPANPKQILRNYYGANWSEPPFVSKEELIDQYGKLWFSKNLFTVTVLKHLSHATLTTI